MGASWERVGSDMGASWICLRRDVEGLECFSLGLIGGKSLTGIFCHSTSVDRFFFMVFLSFCLGMLCSIFFYVKYPFL